jgi:hypothetical protein
MLMVWYMQRPMEMETADLEQRYQQILKAQEKAHARAAKAEAEAQALYAKAAARSTQPVVEPKRRGTLHHMPTSPPANGVLSSPSSPPMPSSAGSGGSGSQPTSSGMHQLKIALSWAQSLGLLIYTFDLDWSRPFYLLLFHLNAIANADFLPLMESNSYIGCSSETRWIEFKHSFSWQMSLLPMLGAFGVVSYILAQLLDPRAPDEDVDCLCLRIHCKRCKRGSCGTSRSGQGCCGSMLPEDTLAEEGKYQPMAQSSFTRLVQVMLFGVFAFYPGICAKCFRMYKCVDLGGNHHATADVDAIAPETYLLADLRMKCWSGEHLDYVGTAGMCLGIFVIGLPLLVLACLYGLNAKLLAYPHSKSLRAKWGQLYEGYTERAFYWEAVDMLRKMLLAAALILVEAAEPGTMLHPGTSSPLQLMIAILISAIFFLLQLKYRPSESPTDNWLREICEGHVLCTLIVALWKTGSSSLITSLEVGEYGSSEIYGGTSGSSAIQPEIAYDDGVSAVVLFAFTGATALALLLAMCGVIELNSKESSKRLAVPPPPLQSALAAASYHTAQLSINAEGDRASVRSMDSAAHAQPVILAPTKGMSRVGVDTSESRKQNEDLYLTLLRMVVNADGPAAATANFDGSGVTNSQLEAQRQRLGISMEQHTHLVLQLQPQIPQLPPPGPPLHAAGVVTGNSSYSAAHSTNSAAYSTDAPQLLPSHTLLGRTRLPARDTTPSPPRATTSPPMPMTMPPGIGVRRHNLEQQQNAQLRVSRGGRAVGLAGLERVLATPQVQGRPAGAQDPWTGGRSTVAALAAAAGEHGSAPVNTIDRRRGREVELGMGMATSPFTGRRSTRSVSATDRSVNTGATPRPVWNQML